MLSVRVSIKLIRNSGYPAVTIAKKKKSDDDDIDSERARVVKTQFSWVTHFPTRSMAFGKCQSQEEESPELDLERHH